MTAPEQGAFGSLKPYLVRAHHEWMVDNGLTPQLLVAADRPGVVVPREYVKEGSIVLNISPQATDGLLLGNDVIEFNARFGGKSMGITVPLGAVRGLVAREYGVGVTFVAEESEEEDAGQDVSVSEADDSSDPGDGDGPPDDGGGPTGGRRRPSLRVVK